MPARRTQWPQLPPAQMPLVVAHRGSSDRHPEHTLAAYERAIADGADVLECDVRLTADGHLVCVHDRRIDRTSDGRGVVSTKTLAQLREQDFGDHSDPAQVLLLEDLIRLSVSAGRPVGLAIETKHPTRYAGLVEQRVVEMLRDFDLVAPRYSGDARIFLMSFSELAMRRWREMSPSLPCVFLMDEVPLRCRKGWLPFSAAIAGPSVEIVREHPGYVKRAHDAGRRVFVWTVDEPDDVELCLRLGVDAIISNRPGEVRRIVGSGLPHTSST